MYIFIVPVGQYIYAMQKYAMVHMLQDGLGWSVSFHSMCLGCAIEYLTNGIQECHCLERRKQVNHPRFIHS